MLVTSVYQWVFFHLLILFLLYVDLRRFEKRMHEIKMREALFWSGFWIALSLLFNGYIYFQYGKEAALQFLAGYLVEKSLSVDNLFVFLLIFSYFQTPKIYQHKVLHYGILGTLVTRILFILGGTVLINQFHWTIYLFGIFLCITALRFLIEKEKKMQPEGNFLIRLCKKMLPVVKDGDGRFFVKKKGRLFVTPLFIVLLAIEGTDIVFATDSIPAIFAITTDPFLVYTSNIFAILGLRSLYFVLAQFISGFYYLKQGLAAILLFVGAKMLLSSLYPISIELSLGIIFLILFISSTASLLKK